MTRFIQLSKSVSKAVSNSHEDDKAQELRNVRLTSVSLVDAGANGKEFSLLKRDGDSGQTSQQDMGFWKRLTKVIFGEQAEITMGGGDGTSGSDRAKQLEAVVKLRAEADRAATIMAETGKKGALGEFTKALADIESGLSDGDLVRKTTNLGESTVNERIAAMERELAELKKNAAAPATDEDQDKILAKYGYTEYEDYDDDSINSAVNADVLEIEAEYTKRSPAEVQKSLEADDDLSDVEKAFTYEAYVRYMPSGKKPMGKNPFAKYLAAMAEKGFKPRSDKAGRPKYSKDGRPAMRRAATKVTPKKDDDDTSKSTATPDAIAQSVVALLAPTIDALSKRVEAIEGTTQTATQTAAAAQDTVTKMATRLSQTRQVPRNQGGIRVTKTQLNDAGQIVDPTHENFWDGFLNGDAAPTAQ